jgi:hypothetical protein
MKPKRIVVLVGIAVVGTIAGIWALRDTKPATRATIQPGDPP